MTVKNLIFLCDEYLKRESFTETEEGEKAAC